MPAHIYPRKDRGSTYYLRDGAIEFSLRTTKAGLAEYKLKQYILGKHGPGRKLSVQQYFDSWIETKVEPLVRWTWIRDVSQHFRTHILPDFGSKTFSAVTLGELRRLQAKLIAKGLSTKTVRNIIDSSFRTMWQDARHDIAEIEDRNPFAALTWPRREKDPPDPFTAAERDRILAYWKETDRFYYPWIVLLFHTGMRPSEAAALDKTDVDLQAGTIRIRKSITRGRRTSTKTRHSVRLIKMAAIASEALGELKSWDMPGPALFLNKYGERINSKKWAEHYWPQALELLGINHRKYYSTRHTFITEMIKAGHSYAEVGDYCGTSGKMIEEDYRGPLELTALKFDSPVLLPEPAKSLNSLVAGPGFEPYTPTADNVQQRRKVKEFKGFKKRNYG